MSSTDAAAVGHLLTSLDKQDRLIVLLHYADGLTSAEISRLLGRSAAAIEATLDTIRRAARAVVRGGVECAA